MVIDLRKLKCMIWKVLLFLIICFPRMMQAGKIFIIGCLVVLFFLSKGEAVISRSLTKFIILWCGYCLVTMTTGILNGNVKGGIVAFGKLNIINVAIYIFLVIAAKDTDICADTLETIFGAAVYISLYNLLLIGAGIIGIQIPFIEVLDATSRVGIHSGYTHIVTTNLSMTIVLFPFLLLMKDYIIEKCCIGNRIYYMCLFLCGMAMLLSGRRIIWGSLVAGLAASWMWNTKGINLKIRKAILLLIIMGVGLLAAEKTHVISVSGLISRLFEAFSKTDEYGIPNVRDVQATYLIEGFLKHPLWGQGAGATIKGYARSLSSPWIFELSYFVILFQSGIIGSLFYIGAILSIIENLLEIMRYDKPLGISLSVSFAVAIIANATNPYFSSSFDFLIFIFLPFFWENRYLNCEPAGHFVGGG